MLHLCIRLLGTSRPIDVLVSSPGRKGCSRLQTHFEISACHHPCVTAGISWAIV